MVFLAYGLPDESELIIKPNVVATTLIELNLEYNGRIIRKKLPSTLLLQKLIMLIQKLYKLQERPRLKRISMQQSDIIVDMDDEIKELGYYSVQDGDSIIVEI